MINNDYDKKINVKYSEMDCNLGLKPSALMNFLQDLASDNAESLGFGYSYVSQNNLMWFLLKYRMEFTDYPISVYDLVLKTQPRGCAKLFAYRDFELWDKGEKLLGKVASIWGLTDKTTKSLAHAEKSLANTNMTRYEKQEEDLAFAKIPALEKVDAEQFFEIRYEDIDVNNHANNSNYIIWALEPLSFDFRRSHKIKTLDMVFKKEIVYGHKVQSQIEFKSDNTTLHVVKNAETGDDLCHILIEWT